MREESIEDQLRECFNRYMVECEWRFRFCDALLRQIVLIDTWWNVND